MIRFEASIMIERPVVNVFEFVADGENGSKWNSAVLDVKKISEGPVGVGTQYWMARQLGNRRVENSYEVIEFEPNKKLSIKTRSGPTPFEYRYVFEGVEKRTSLSLVAEAEKEGLVDVLGVKARIAPEPVLASFLKRRVEANFRTLKNLLEHNI